MAKYIFATKFKKIEKEPLYYNIQVSVDKDYSNMNPMEPGYEIEIYKDAPIVMEYLKDSISELGFPQWGSTIHSAISRGIGRNEGQLWFYLEGESMFCMCQDYDFYITEIIQVDHNGTIFTFTPIPVYEIEPEHEPLYYNIQMSVDKDYTYSPNGAARIAPPEAKEIHFSKNSPIILTLYSGDHWTSSEIGEIDILSFNQYTVLQLWHMTYFKICNGFYPLPRIISVVYDGTTFTFTPIPVYE
jgi:hypothetical protein